MEEKREVKIPWEWKKERCFTFAMIFIAVTVYFLSRAVEVSVGIKLTLGIILLFIFLIVIIATLTVKKDKDKESDSDEKDNQRLIRNIQENESWILRNAWSSDPGDINEELNAIYEIIRTEKIDRGIKPGEYKIEAETDNDGYIEVEDKDGVNKKVTILESLYPMEMLEQIEDMLYENKNKEDELILPELKGYREKKEGWNYYIPRVWHEDVGTVNRMPIARSPEENITVNTKDNQTAEIDYRIVTVISDPIRYSLRVKTEEQRIAQENQKSEVVFNRISSFFTQEQLTSFEGNNLLNLTRIAKHFFNIEMRHLGIRSTSLEIKTLLMPEEIRDTAEYQTVTEGRAKVAGIKGKELKTIIKKTGASPTAVVLADLARGTIIDTVEAVSHFFSKEKKDEVEK